MRQEAYLEKKYTCCTTNAECNNLLFWRIYSKRQPTGALEIKKSVNKLMTLRSQLRSKSKVEAVRATTQRLITDLEMNSTYRGAVEITNLCRNLHKHDTLFAECIRTFGSQVLDGRSWMYRMESIFTKQDLDSEVIQTYTPPAKNPTNAQPGVYPIL